MILCIETATPVCSVALCDPHNVIFMRGSDGGRSHSADLTVFIEEIFNEAGILPSDLEAVAVSRGPGSYTGLRIGVSTAKGIAYGAGLPLIGIDTTLSLFSGYLQLQGKIFTETDLFCPAIDARRMEIYHAIYNIKGSVVKELKAEVISPESFSEIPEKHRIFFFGDGSAKFSRLITRRNCVFDQDYSITASAMRVPAYEAFGRKQFEDIAYFEPFYLKDFIATVPVNKLK